MRIEIDQSNKIEQTNKDTVIGLSNSKVFTVIIKRQTKRKLQKDFRKQNQPRLFVYLVFISSVVLLLNYAKIKNISEIVIDEEYSGYEKFFKQVFLRMYSKSHKKIPNVRIGNIGKKSGAHYISYLTMKKKIKANVELTYSEIKNLCLKKLDA
ncbi:hypothetical protein D4R87_01665 [bacterium]|nr:MAG: hypothetical protein D4R87_01665 [bacterium]